MNLSNSSNWLPTSTTTRSVIAVAFGMIVVGVVARLLPHPPNVSPIASMAMFGGAYFASKRWALSVPLVAMLVSDALIGFHGAMWAVYVAFAVSVLLGRWVRRRASVTRVASATIASTLAFFLISNLAVWFLWYPATLGGLVTCYTLAIPFLQNSLLGNAFFTTVLFGSAALLHAGLAKPLVPAFSHNR